jgi:sporulation-control protein spo0M
MDFTNKMRDGLGASGARVEVRVPDSPVAAGARLAATVVITGGNKAAQIDALMLRLIEARRHWRTPDGETMSEADAQALDDRSHLIPGWTRTTTAELRVKVGHTVEAGEPHDVEVQIEVPESCQPTAADCSHTLNVQADIKGQIDPTGNATVTVA